MDLILQNSSAIVLAAGKGTRMGSKIPKVLRKVQGKPLVSYILDTFDNLSLKQVILVVGHKADLVKNRLGDKYFYAHQEQPLGTADAVKSGVNYLLQTTKYVFVINGDDSSLLSHKTITDIIHFHAKSLKSMTLVSSIQENVPILFKVLKDQNNNFLGFDKESSESTKEIATGIYVFNKNWLEKYIKLIKKSGSGVYNLPDVVNFALAQKSANCFTLPDSNEWRSANTPIELNRVRRIMKRRNIK